jgi:hypothetical protein
VVTNIVDHRQPLALVSSAQSSPKLLQPQNLGFSGSEHHDRIKLWKVHAFIKHVYGTYDIELSSSEFPVTCPAI